MSARLQDKTAVVTAAAAGIGRRSVERLAEEGAQVWATDIDLEGLESLAATSDRVRIHQLDMTDGEAIQSFGEQVGAVDVLFNCAGFVHNGTILECDDRAWDFSFDLNVRGAFRMIRAMLPAMLANGGGSIINMSSVASSLKGVPDRFVYTATKAAVIGMTKSIAADYIKQGIRCNAVCPGTVDTPSLQARLNEFDDPVQARKDFENRQPLGRLGTVDELANLIVYLASDESTYTTGTTQVIDGGWCA